MRLDVISRRGHVCTKQLWSRATEAARRPFLRPRVLTRLGSIAVSRLPDLRGRDPRKLLYEINLETGRPIWRRPLTIQALQSLVDAAEQEAARHGPTPKRD